MGEADKWAGKHRDVLPFDADLLLNVIEQVFEMERENFFGSGKNKRIITAKEVFILIGENQVRPSPRCPGSSASTSQTPAADSAPRDRNARPIRGSKAMEESTGEVQTENRTIPQC
ncbi:MAG: hypothetical protein IPP63_12895 [Chloracidobacterium sp.]|nr:hypothetical protein [Chloracidobacterium sp.]